MARPKLPRLLDVAGVALAALTAACAPDAVTGSNAATVHGANAAIASTSSVFTVQLRALPLAPADPYYGFGNLQLRLGGAFGDSCFPNDPISPVPGTTIVSVCGKIFNAGGALYTGGGIYWTGGLGDVFNVLIAAFNGAVPPNPCHRYDVAGVVTVPDAVAADMIANTSSYAVRFDGQVSGSTARVGGRLDGTAWGSVSYPTDPNYPGDPYFAQKVCSVSVIP